MERIPVKSSQIAAIGYDAETKTLAVEFLGKGTAPRSVYHYHDVPPETHAALMGAESIGKYFGANVRAAHKFTKQDPEGDANGRG